MKDSRGQATSEDRNLEALKNALLESIPVRKRLDALGRSDLLKVLNVAQFALLFNFDVSCLVTDIPRVRGTWRAKLYGRLLALLLYESITDMTELLGGEFRNLPTIVALPDRLEQLNQIHGKFSVSLRRHGRTWKAIRGSVIAHREHDAEAQLKQLQMVHVKTLLDQGYEAMSQLSALYGLLGEIIADSEARRKSADA